MNKLSVIIPAYKEEHRIGATLLAIHNYLSRQPYQSEILVVVDGSPDKTAEVVESYRAKIANLKVFNNQQNRGKGWVVRQGMLAAEGDFRLFTDADNSTSIEQVAKLLPYVAQQGYDIAIGSIEVPGAEVHEHAQWYRRWVGHLVKYLIRFVLNLWNIRDTQRGFKLFSAAAATAVFSRAKVSRFGFDFEILAVAKRLGLKVREVPVVWNNAGESTVNLNSYFATFRDLLQVRWNLWSGRYR
ncbi:MAG TPA: dolichyl-phosphate beta-glucosyltransferase [Patescibacteria group bacterium]|nr:dolichyl-phosphate beta-glucosyltransferase [Patescibacteria group bacterium]